MNFDEYLFKNYNNDIKEFLYTEIKRPEHLSRIGKVVTYKNYLNGMHKINSRENIVWKGEELNTTKLCINKAKTILNIHDTYLMGNKPTLTGSEHLVHTFNNIYRKGGFNNTFFKVLQKVNRFGDCWSYVYVDNNSNITSKLILSEMAYPILDENDEYIAFIEYFKDNKEEDNFVLYLNDKVKIYKSDKDMLSLVDDKLNLTGLPIHFHNFSESSELSGESELKDMIPMLDKYEELISKMIDAVYCLSMNPLGVVVGQEVAGKVDAELVGQLLNLDCGDFDFKTAMLDYNSIKCIIDNLNKSLEEVASVPSIAMGNSNIANVSETTLKMLYELATKKAMINEKWLGEGIEQVNDKIISVLDFMGEDIGQDSYIDIKFNYSRPQNDTELLDNLSKQYNDGALSIESYIERSYLTTDTKQEIDRLSGVGCSESNITAGDVDTSVVNSKVKVVDKVKERIKKFKDKIKGVFKKNSQE